MSNDSGTLKAQWDAYFDSGAPPLTAKVGERCYLADVCVMTCSGPDAAGFLQGYLTSDTDELSDNAWQPWALCNLKGRVVANGWSKLGHEQVTLLTHHSLVERLLEFFRPYLAFAKAELEDSSSQTLVFGVLGEPSAADVVAPGVGLQVMDDLAAAKALASQGLVDAAAWHERLQRAEICLVSTPTSESFLPQMLGLTAIGAVSFDKGCYLGQEVVARAQHRGAVKRTLHRLDWQGPIPEAGAALTAADGSAAGTVINASAGEASDQGICLAVVGNEAVYPLTNGDTRLNPSTPPG